MKAKLILTAGLTLACSSQLFADAAGPAKPAGPSLPAFILNTTNFQYRLVPAFQPDENGLIATNSRVMDYRIQPDFFEGSLIIKQTAEDHAAPTEAAPASHIVQYFNFADFGPAVDYVTNAPPSVFDPLYFVSSSKFDALIPKDTNWKKLDPAQVFRQVKPYEWMEGYDPQAILDKWITADTFEADAQPVELVAWRF